MTNGSRVRSHSLKMEGEAIKESVVHGSTAEIRPESMSGSRMANGDGEWRWRMNSILRSSAILMFI